MPPPGGRELGERPRLRWRRDCISKGRGQATARHRPRRCLVAPLAAFSAARLPAPKCLRRAHASTLPRQEILLVNLLKPEAAGAVLTSVPPHARELQAAWTSEGLRAVCFVDTFAEEIAEAPLVLPPPHRPLSLMWFSPSSGWVTQCTVPRAAERLTMAGERRLGLGLVEQVCCLWHDLFQTAMHTPCLCLGHGGASFPLLPGPHLSLPLLCFTVLFVSLPDVIIHPHPRTTPPLPPCRRRCHLRLGQHAQLYSRGGRAG